MMRIPLRLTAAAALAVSGMVLAATPATRPAPVAPAAPGVRAVTDLTSGWRFRFGGDAAGVTEDRYDDSGWQSVALPHSWNRLGSYTLARAGTGRNNAHGTGWYRLAFTAPAATRGRRVFLQFDGVGAVAKVWLNGRAIGGHSGAFSRFRFDVTDAIRPGGRNLLVVSADNARPKPGSATADVLPLSGDFFIYGGLYRGVSLVTTSDAQIDMLDHGGPGIYARTLGVDGGTARIGVHARLRNLSTRGRRLALETAIVDAAGRTVARTATPVAIAATGTAEPDQTLAIPAVHLWDGRVDPYLYRVVATLTEGGRAIDSVSQPLGVRTMRFDPDTGFFLNGRHLALHGVSRHQDLAGKGWALTAGDHAADMAIIEEVGANTIRMAHYEHAQEWADEADRAGMVAWAEVPFVTASSLDAKLPTAALTDNARQQLVELIRQDYNHPSIAMWSVGNEVNAGELFLAGNKPQQSLGLLRTLAGLARQEDPSRPTTFADCCEPPTGLEAHGPMLAGTTNLIGYNRYFGWYYGKPSDFGPALDTLHARHPAIPMSVSEYGAGGALSQHTDDPEGGAIAVIGRPHPEEYQSWWHEQSWQQLAARPYLFATWVWAMFDFASDMRGEGDSVDLNDKGLVTFDRKTRKDSFYFYKSRWTDAPMLHLNSSRYTDRDYPVTDVRAYTTAPRATLSLNGRTIGAIECPDRICVWRDVVLAPGRNTVVVSATAGGVALSETAQWTAPGFDAGIHIDAGELNGRMIGATRYGSDAFFDGGTATVLNPLDLHAGIAGRVAKPKVVTGSDDAALYRAYREGDFSYAIPLPDGRWTVTVHSFEPDPDAAQPRTFELRANGRRVARIAPAAVAGGALKTMTKSVTVRSTGGRLRLDFKSIGGRAVIAALDIKKG